MSFLRSGYSTFDLGSSRNAAQCYNPGIALSSHQALNGSLDVANVFIVKRSCHSLQAPLIASGSI